jgi:hypothetical protein
MLVELKDTYRKVVILPEHYDYLRVEGYHKELLRQLEPIAPLRLKQRHVSLLKRYVREIINLHIVLRHIDQSSLGAFLSRQRMYLAFRRYIPAAIQPALKAGHDEHLAEIREVSVLFVKCNGISIVASEDGNCANVCVLVSQLDGQCRSDA